MAKLKSLRSHWVVRDQGLSDFRRTGLFLSSCRNIISRRNEACNNTRDSRISIPAVCLISEANFHDGVILRPRIASVLVPKTQLFQNTCSCSGIVRRTRHTAIHATHKQLSGAFDSTEFSTISGRNSAKIWCH